MSARYCKNLRCSGARTGKPCAAASDCDMFLWDIEKEKGTILIERKTAIDKKYEDRDKVSAWAVVAMATLNNAEIIKGSTNTTLFPSGTATVQEAVLMAVRVFAL